MNKVLEEKEIIEALEQNTKWQGSREEMWSEIVSHVKKPLPWYKQKRPWLSIAAAAMIFLMVMIRNGLPEPTIPKNDHEELPQIEMFTTRMAPMSVGISPIGLEIELPDTVEANASFTINLALVNLDDQELIIHDQVVRIMESNQASGLVTIITETSVDQPLAESIVLLAPDNPGLYQVEISISGFKNEKPIFISEISSFTVE